MTDAFPDNNPWAPYNEQETMKKDLVVPGMLVKHEVDAAIESYRQGLIDKLWDLDLYTNGHEETTVRFNDVLHLLELKMTNTPPPMWENRDASINTRDEPRTLDNTSRLLVRTLRFLIDDYGYAGVMNALELIKENDG